MKQQEIGELPTGCSQIIGTNVGCLRKLIWLVFFAGGIIYSTKSIYKNCLVYFEYRSSIKPRFASYNRASNMPFPRIIICPNGMHSLSKMRLFYPELSNSSGAMRLLYSTSGAKYKESDLFESVRNISYDEFLDKTALDFEIIGCKFGDTRCTNSWKVENTKYGKCKSFDPDELVLGESFEQSGQELTLSLVAAFNQSDASIGYLHFLTGLSLYYSDINDRTIATIRSVTMSPSSVPIVALKQTHKQLLGEPYSICQDEKSHPLRRFLNYTKGHCKFECLADTVENTCNCTMNYLRGENDAIKKELRKCSVQDQATCVAKIVKGFNNPKCDCLNPCSEKIPEGQFVQYGEYKNGREMLQQGGIKFDTMASAVLYIPEVLEHVNQEVPDYEWEQFMGDVGGSAGLVLGVSLATILSTLDWFATSFCRFFGRVRESYRNGPRRSSIICTHLIILDQISEGIFAKKSAAEVG